MSRAVGLILVAAAIAVLTSPLTIANQVTNWPVFLAGGALALQSGISLARRNR
jgi:hypothetical protein